MIRPAAPADVPAIHQMMLDLAEYERGRHEVTATAGDLHRALFGERPALFAHVAEDGTEDGTELAGFAVWFLNYSTWAGRHGIYLEDLYVRPAKRGAGHGKALLAELARICVERGYPRLQWWVLDWNTPAIGFYGSIGATAMTEWTVFRLAGPRLRDLAAAGAGPQP